MFFRCQEYVWTGSKIGVKILEIKSAERNERSTKLTRLKLTRILTIRVNFMER